MDRAEQFIRDYTRNYSNLFCNSDNDCQPWLTPDQALRAVEIGKEELLEKATKWLENNIAKETTIIYSGVVSINFDRVIKEFKKAMEE